MNGTRQLFFNPVSGELRFDVPYPKCNDIPRQIAWPGEQQRFNKPYGFKNLTLALTMRCNLDCDYCWQTHNCSSDMQLTLIDRWLDFFLDSEKNTPNKILYYGGEPLLRMDLITYAAQHMKRLCAQRGLPIVKQHIFTNGTLLTEENLDSLQEAGVFIIISVDGNPQVNSTHRRTAQGQSVDSEIMKGIERLHRRCLPFGVCCTISNVCFDVDATVGFIVKELRPSTLELNLRHDKAFCTQVSPYEGRLLSSFPAAWDMLQSHKINNIDLQKRLFALSHRIPLQNSSSGSKNKLSVMANGKVSTFNGAVSFPELQIDPAGNWIVPFRKRWSRDILTKESCKTCSAAYICGQGSAFSSFLQYGDFDHTPALHCEYCNTILHYIIENVQQKLPSLRELPYGYVVQAEDYAALFPAAHL